MQRMMLSCRMISEDEMIFVRLKFWRSIFNNVDLQSSAERLASTASGIGEKEELFVLITGSVRRLTTVGPVSNNFSQNLLYPCSLNMD